MREEREIKIIVDESLDIENFHRIIFLIKELTLAIRRKEIKENMQ